MDQERYLTSRGWVQDCSNMWHAPNMPSSVWVTTERAVAVQGALDKGEPFHAHLEVCAQCRDHPFDLCPTGATAIRVQASLMNPQKP
jgi:hypothetical protein